MLREYTRLPGGLKRADLGCESYGARTKPREIMREDEKGKWSDERTELLKTLWANGLSGSQIAKRLGKVTRNAVIGKAHRLGLPLRGGVTRTRASRSKRPSAPRKRLDGREFAPVLAAEPLPPEPERPAVLTKFEKLTESMCKFPYGDPKSADFGFCGCAKVTGLPYCRAHALVAFRPAEPKKRKPLDELMPSTRGGAGSHRVLREVLA